MSDHRRVVYIMRHAERVDFTFGNWIPKCFDADGAYIRKDLNMPVSVPSRSGGPRAFFKDCPLTNVGVCQSKLTGQAMKDNEVKFSHVFASPSLRCIETCSNALEASGQSHLPINIEPGLFEWLSWYRDGMPSWMTPEELRAAGYFINMDYKPVVMGGSLINTEESIEQYYMRSYFLMRELLDKYKDGNIFLIGHAATLDTCTRQLVGSPPRDFNQFQHVIYRTPYASVVTVTEETDNKWKLGPPPFPSASVMHSNNISYDWNVLNCS